MMDLLDLAAMLTRLALIVGVCIAVYFLTRV